VRIENGCIAICMSLARWVTSISRWWPSPRLKFTYSLLPTATGCPKLGGSCLSIHPPAGCRSRTRSPREPDGAAGAMPRTAPAAQQHHTIALVSRRAVDRPCRWPVRVAAMPKQRAQAPGLRPTNH